MNAIKFFSHNVFKGALLFAILLFGLSPQYRVHATDASILPQGVTQFADDDGNPLSSGKVYFYIPNTLTFKTTWQNAAKSITNTNPVDLDAGGRAIIYGDGVYRQIVKKANGDTVYDAVTTSPLTGSAATLVGDGNLVSTVLPWAGLVAPAQYAFAYGQELARATYPEFFAAITSSQTTSCTVTSPTITGLSDTSQIIVGTAVEVACMAAGTTVVSKTLTTATLSNNANASTTATAVFLPWGGGNGTTTFNAPDLRGYNPAGRDNMGGTASLRLANGNGLGRPLGIANFNYQTPVSTYFTTQRLTSGTTYTPTSASVTNIVVEMSGPGGGGAGGTANNGNNGSAATSFQVNSTGTAWTVNPGSGGAFGAGGGGVGGSAGNAGTGTQINRVQGGWGQGGGATVTANTGFPGGAGGVNPFGGDGGGAYVSAGNAGTSNSGAGGAGGGSNSGTSSGGGGGAGEYVKFWASGVTTATYAIGTGGTGGGAGTRAGAAGGDGVIVVYEYYNTTATTSTSFTATTAGTLEQQRTINYVVKITPDTSTSSATGVASLGGMTGVITCGSGLTCTSNNVAVSFPFFYTTLIASAQSVNLNSANTDNAMTVTLPVGTTNYRITAIMVQNNGTTASLTTATAGLFSAAAGGGLALAANQALSAITANAVNTDANSLSLTQTVASRTVINSATLYFRVGTAQGAASTANVYVYGQPMP